MAQYTIDRFESTAWAVLQDEQGKTFLVPRRWLPVQAREGDVVIEMAQPPDNDTVSLTFHVDHAATEERRARVKAQREQPRKTPEEDVKL